MVIEIITQMILRIFHLLAREMEFPLACFVQ